MPEFKNALNINVSISEFLLLSVGVFSFREFHKVRKVDLDFVLDWAALIGGRADLDLLHRRFNGKADSTEEYNAVQHNHFSIFKRVKENEVLLTSGFYENCFSKKTTADLSAIYKISELFSVLKKDPQYTLPTPIKEGKSKVEGKREVYNLIELAEYLDKYIDVSDVKFIPLIRSLFTQPYEYKKPTIPENDNIKGYIKINTLPEIMQFMIECSAEPSYQHSNINNKDKALKKFKSDTVTKIVELSLSRSLTHLQNKKLSNGISKTKAEYVFDFIQKNKPPLN